MRVCSLKIFTVSTNYNQFTTGLGLGRRESRRKGGLCLLPAVFWMELSKGSTKLWVQTGYYNLLVQTGTKMACFCGIRTRTLASSCDSLDLEVFFTFFFNTLYVLFAPQFITPWCLQRRKLRKFPRAHSSIWLPRDSADFADFITTAWELA